MSRITGIEGGLWVNMKEVYNPMPDKAFLGKL